jgi:hypothetical protein
MNENTPEKENDIGSSEETNTATDTSEKEVAELQKDLDIIGDKLENEEITPEEYTEEASKSLVEHSYINLCDLYSGILRNATIFKERENDCDPQSKKKMNEDINSFTLESIIDIFVRKNLIKYRDDDAYFKEVYSKFVRLISSNSKKKKDMRFPNIKVFKAAEFLGKDLDHKIFRHFVVAVFAYINENGWGNSARFVHQLMLNLNFATIALKVHKIGGKEDLFALQALMNGIKKFNDTILDEVTK